MIAAGTAARFLRLLSTLAICLCVSVLANTEIRHFRPSNGLNTYTPADQSMAVSSILQHLHASFEMIAPYTTTDRESIASLQSTDSTTYEKERWYPLKHLKPGQSYEVRVSYAATTPADFIIDLFSLEEMLDRYNISYPITKPQLTSSEQVMFARVTASYSGVSVFPGMENKRIPYRFVLEKHVLGLPIQALKLIAVLVLVIACAIFWLTPRVLAAFDVVLADEQKHVVKQD